MEEINDALKYIAQAVELIGVRLDEEVKYSPQAAKLCEILIVLEKAMEILASKI